MGDGPRGVRVAWLENIDLPGDLMSDKVIVLIPEAPAAEAVANAPRSSPLPPGRLRIGLLDNGKGNADHLLNRIFENLSHELDISSMLLLRKNSVSLAADRAHLDRFVAETDLVITAMAD